MYKLALLRQYDPLPDKFEDRDELWIIEALPPTNGIPLGYAKILCRKSHARPPQYT